MSTPRTRTTRAVSLLVAIALAATACTDDSGSADEPGSDEPGGPGPAAPPAALETTSTIGRVTGKLAEGRRQRVKERVSAIVDGWIDAAYVAGDYPRSDFKDAFPGFNAGARTEALSDIDLMTNAQVGERIDGVEATKRRLRVDVLAVKRRAVGVTARFVLDFDTVGDVERSQRVRGRLYLTWRQGDWQVFGYDVTRGSAR